MKKIDKLTEAPAQKLTIIGENGESINFFLRYLPSQQRWMFNISYSDFTLNGVELTVSPNIFRGYSNILPFGMAVICTDSLDPFYLDDFTTGRVSIYLLNSDDVKSAKALFSI